MSCPLMQEVKKTMCSIRKQALKATRKEAELPTCIIIKKHGDSKPKVVLTGWANDEEKETCMTKIYEDYGSGKTDYVVFTGLMWLGTGTEIRPMDDPNRREILMILGVTPDDSVCEVYSIERPPSGKTKLRKMKDFFKQDSKMHTYLIDPLFFHNHREKLLQDIEDGTFYKQMQSPQKIQQVFDAYDEIVKDEDYPFEDFKKTYESMIIRNMHAAATEAKTEDELCSLFKQKWRKEELMQ